jgi:hypothetical protein
VPLGFLAQATAGNPADGGSICATRLQVCFLRRTLAGSPFAIVTSYGGGYGLFRADEIEVEARHRGDHFRLRRDVAAGPVTGSFPDMSLAGEPQAVPRSRVPPRLDGSGA